MMNLDIIKTLANKKIKFAEIGVERGRTTLKVCEILKEGSQIHLYDYEKFVNKVEDKIRNIYGYKFIIKKFAVIKGDYNWHLMNLIDKKININYDYVYLDGAHTLTIDGLAFFLIDKLLNVGGYIEFDDYDWSIATSVTCSPFPPVNNIKIMKDFTVEQISVSHIKLIIDNLVKTNKRYKEIVKNRIFQKISDEN